MPENTKRKEGETVTPVEPEGVQPSSQDTTGDPGKQYSDAHQRFEHTIQRLGRELSLPKTS